MHAKKLSFGMLVLEELNYSLINIHMYQPTDNNKNVDINFDVNNAFLE
jgi:hypothetical protein